MQRQNYQKEMEKTVQSVQEGTQLLLHSCCGPCSSSVLEQLAQRFRVTLLYYNPNIWPQQEYERRREEQKDVLQKLDVVYPIEFVEIPYVPEQFARAAKGLEQEPERGARCTECFKLRLEEAAHYAAEREIPWYTTTLTVSPHKNADLLNEIGRKMAEKYGVFFLPSDFKKKEGYKRSLEISTEMGLYRQDYCGCVYSYKQRKQEQMKDNNVP